MKMATVYDISADKLIKKVSTDLKENLKFERPEWSLFVKTSVHKEGRPDNIDWWYTRAASVLRRIYIDGPVGIQRLRTHYGGLKHRGSKPEEFRRGSGKIIRTILQQFEKIGFIEKKSEKKNKSGRIITKKGMSYLDKMASGSK